MWSLIRQCRGDGMNIARLSCSRWCKNTSGMKMQRVRKCWRYRKIHLVCKDTDGTWRYRWYVKIQMVCENAGGVWRYRWFAKIHIIWKSPDRVAPVNPDQPWRDPNVLATLTIKYQIYFFNFEVMRSFQTFNKNAHGWFSRMRTR